MAIAQRPLLPDLKVGCLFDGWRLEFRGANPLRDPEKPPLTVFKFKKEIMGRTGVAMLSLPPDNDDLEARDTMQISLRMAEQEISRVVPIQGHA